MPDQYVDPSVSRKKFEAELEEFKSLRSLYENRGWFLVEACFPKIFMILGASKLKPPAIVFGIVFDYTNYDACPPSVIFVNPFTRVPLLYSEILPPLRLNRMLPSSPLGFPGVGLPGMSGQIQLLASQPLLQAISDDEIPFLCIAGVLEYHENPGHSGDIWELHRADGAGRLVRLLEVVSRFGVEPIRGYGVNLQPQVGFDFDQPPQ